MCCTVDEAKTRVSPQAFIDWLSYWETNPSIRDMINYSQANTSRTIAAVNAKRGASPKLKDFLFDFDRAKMSDREKVANDVRKFFKRTKKV